MLQDVLATLWGRLITPYWNPWQQNVRQWRNYHELTRRVGWQALRPFFSGDMRETSRLLLNVLERDSLYPDLRYRHFSKPKADGTPRKLAEPDSRLKDIQQQIRKQYLKRAPAHPAAVGFRRKKSTADHAAAHAGAHTIVTADMVDFFPNTRAHRVESWWATIFPDFPDAARLYTLLTTYKDSLPQGAPTSPDLSNLVNFDLDAALERRVKNSGGVYTRYCDDLAFSWRGRSDMPSDFEAGVRGALGEYGYRLHEWQVFAGHDEPELTGIVLKRNGSLDLPDDMRQTMRQLARSGDTARLDGYRAYEHMVKRR